MNKQTLIAQWWHTGRDFQQGMQILEQFSKNNFLINRLNYLGPQKGQVKLRYELMKIAGYEKTWNTPPPYPQHITIPEKPSFDIPENPTGKKAFWQKIFKL